MDFTSDGTKQCPEGFFLKGLYRTTCSTINCLTRIRCCRMIPGKISIGNTTVSRIFGINTSNDIEESLLTSLLTVWFISICL